MAASHRAAPTRSTAMKAVKNNAEIAGTRAAHLRDGAALTRFPAWFDNEAATGLLTEIGAVRALNIFRRDTGRAAPRIVPEHFRRRAKWRHRALPRRSGKQIHHRQETNFF